MEEEVGRKKIWHPFRALNELTGARGRRHVGGGDMLGPGGLVEATARLLILNCLSSLAQS